MIGFGTGGWRAVIGEEFTKANVQLLTAALARKMKDEGTQGNGFVIGYDRRFLSVEAAKWAAEVMAGEGIACKLVNREAPTPLIMFAVKYYDMAYGMAVTASHNPAIYNGIKVFVKGGRDADETVTADIERYIAGLEGDSLRAVPYEQAVSEGLVEEINPQNPYLDSIIRGINMDAIRSRSLKIILDPMYGVSKTSLQTILLTARCDVDVIHDRHDTLFGGRLPAPNVETLGALRNAVLERKADIGIATDGDADRLGIIDDKGHFVHPNQILVILYYYLLKYKGWHGAAVRNIATTHLLDKVAKAFGETCYEVPVGFKHISGKMLETNAVIGGESSGGLTVRGHIQGKDGVFQYPGIFFGNILILLLHQDIPEMSVFRGHFGKIQLADVPGDSGLRHRKTALIKFCRQFLLRFYLILADQLDYFRMPRYLHLLLPCPSICNSSFC